MKRQDIVAEARRFVELGTRWRIMGRTDARLDCYGLIIKVRERFGLASEDYQRYGLYPQDNIALDTMKRMFTQVHPPLKPGQVVVFSYDNRPWHMGITSIDRYGRFSVIHCGALAKKAIEEPFEGLLKNHFRAAFEFPGVED